MDGWMSECVTLMHGWTSAEEVEVNVSMYLGKNSKQVGAAGLVKEVCSICNLSTRQVCVSTAASPTIPVSVRRLVVWSIRRHLQKLLDGVEQPLCVIAG